MRKNRVLALVLATIVVFLTLFTLPLMGSGDTGSVADPNTDSGTLSSVEHGRSIWFNNTYGGEKFFVFLANHPDPEKRISIAFEKVIATPRHKRFDVWGVLNDPDCQANPKGGPDICTDPNATGVIGIRQFPTPDGMVLHGVTCAGCHAGFHPLKPPLDPNRPKWDNIHPTIGNQYLKAGKIFATNLDPDDVRRLMFAAWPDGTVDTTLLFSDNIMNPSVITAFWEHPNRPTFDVGLDQPKLRNGQGGEDDLGGDIAAMRVYTNIGVCFFECVAPAVATGTPISINACRQQCPDFPPQEDLNDLTAFLATIERPKFPFPGKERTDALYQRGSAVFADNCQTCHDNQGKLARVLSNDEVIPLNADVMNATNACRALTTNWDEGRIWAEFSSPIHKARAAAGNKGYRVMPLSGIWATVPFLHNQSIGDWPPANANPYQRLRYFWVAMLELLSRDREPKVNTLPVDVGPFPAGTPLHYVFSRDPQTGELLCDDFIENRGHHYGAELPLRDKIALIYWLQFQ